MAVYRIRIMGRGADVTISNITKEQYEYWSEIKRKDEEDGDEEAYDIFMNLYNGDHMNDDRVPEEAKFGWDYHNDFGGTILETWAGYTNSCTIDVVEVESEEYNAKEIREVWSLKGEDLWENEGAPEIKFSAEDEVYPMHIPGYIFYAHGYEKGLFFDGVIVADEFDPKKLTVYNDDIDGNDMLTAIEYDGEGVFSDNGDTVGKSLTYYFYNNAEEEDA
jgi:hypothetical protein